MSDSILVRIRLDRFDFAHPAARQTRIDVCIPEVARVSWLLPASMHESLRKAPWEEALDTAHAHYRDNGIVSDPVSESARRTVRAWLSDDEHRDAMHEAWFADSARRHPVSRALLADLELLRSQNAALQGRVDQLLGERHSTNDALADVTVAQRAAEAGPVTVFRASHESIVMGLYTTASEARAHCVAEERRSWATGAAPVFDWIEDEEDGVAELVTVNEDGETETVTGYVVTALEVASKYDEEADE